jgi:hypothetical protein
MKLLRAGIGALFAALLCSTLVRAQPPLNVDDCLKLEKGEARLACYDKRAGYQPKEAPKPEERPAIKWKVRDSGTVSPIGFADVGTKPGLFQVGRTDGEDFTTAKVAVIGVIKAINQPEGFFDGWEPFVGASWDRDTSAKTPKDLRQVLIGISGQIGTPGPRGVSAFPTLRLGYKDDIKAHTSGAFINAHVDIIYLPWVNTPELDGKNSWAFVPYVGMYSSALHSSPESPEDGTYTGPYAGAKLEVNLGAIAERLSFTGQGQYYRDVSVPGEADKRTLRFATVGLKYDLVDPKAKKGWVPSLSLSWQRGTEPVTGEGPSRKTVLGFGVKFD